MPSGVWGREQLEDRALNASEALCRTVEGNRTHLARAMQARIRLCLRLHRLRDAVNLWRQFKAEPAIRGDAGPLGEGFPVALLELLEEVWQPEQTLARAGCTPANSMVNSPEPNPSEPKLVEQIRQYTAFIPGPQDFGSGTTSIGRFASGDMEVLGLCPHYYWWLFGKSRPKLKAAPQPRWRASPREPLRPGADEVNAIVGRWVEDLVRLEGDWCRMATAVERG